MTNLGSRIVPSLLCRDLAETLRFYCGVLGFEVTGCDRPEEPTWAEVRRDGVTLWFYAEAPEGSPSEPVASATLYFFPEDVRALAQDLEGRVAFEWGPEVMPYGMREFGIRDPNGYTLAFAESA